MKAFWLAMAVLAAVAAGWVYSTLPAASPGPAANPDRPPPLLPKDEDVVPVTPPVLVASTNVLPADEPTADADVHQDPPSDPAAMTTNDPAAEPEPEPVLPVVPDDFQPQQRIDPDPISTAPVQEAPAPADPADDFPQLPSVPPASSPEPPAISEPADSASTEGEPPDLAPDRTPSSGEPPLTETTENPGAGSETPSPIPADASPGDRPADRDTAPTSSAQPAATPPPVAAPAAPTPAPPAQPAWTPGAEPRVAKKDDGSVLLDDRFRIKGSGTSADPYIVTWDLLISASEEYQPKKGLRTIPGRIAMLDGKHVRLTGNIAFPLMEQEPRELLAMLNPWDGCCIGVPPTPYDAVEVALTSKVGGSARFATYGDVTGILSIKPHLVGNWLVGLYVMDQATLKPESFGGGMQP